jgi:hypothetical protein
VQTVARHDVGLAAENAGGVFLHIHEFVHTELALIDCRKRAPRRNRWSPRAVASNMKSRSTPSRFKSASCCSNRFSLTLSGLNATFGTVVPARAHQGNAVRLLPWAMPRLPPQL